MNVEVILLLATVVIVGTVLIAILSLTNKGKRLDVEKYRTRWLAIEQSLVRDNEASYHLAVMNGDKLVDSAMRDLGMGGKTMGDRLKLAKNRFSDRNAIWEAHKLRNKIAHEADVRVSHDQARRALVGFKRALKDLGAI